MAETQPNPKRPRDEQSHQDDNFDDDGSKRHKPPPYNSLLNLLDEEEDDDGASTHEPPSQDLTAIFTTLQQELSSTADALDLGSSPFPADPPSAGSDGDGTAECGGDEDESAKSVIRHLLEASDDELGIPNRCEDDNNFQVFNSGEDCPYNFGDNGGLWELEDEAANYYTVLQAELFM